MQRIDVLWCLSDAFLKDLTVVWTRMKVWLEAPRRAASVVVRPQISQHIVAAALQCVPAEVLLRTDDTRESLAARLGASPFLDDARVLNKGNGRRGAHGSKRRRLNERVTQLLAASRGR